MRKHLWTFIAGACVLLIIISVLIIPRLFSSRSTDTLDNYVTVIPEHWWRLSLNDQQLEVLEGLWGSQMSTRQLVEEIWPDILDEFPDFCISILENRGVSWSSRSFEEWARIQCRHFGKGMYDATNEFYYCEMYIGPEDLEESSLSFRHAKEMPLVADRCYRVSFYTDDVLPHPH